MNPFISSFFVAVTAMIVSLVSVKWVYFKVLRVAKDKHLVDMPDSRKLQIGPIPVMGGIAVFFGIVSGLLAGYTIGSLLGVEFGGHMIPIMAALVIMLYMGALDDMLNFSPFVHFVIEILVLTSLIISCGGCIDSLHGLWGVYSFSWWLAVPLTVFAGVGIINAINMIDGINGLSSTISMVCSFFFGLVFIRGGDVTNAVIAFSASAALVPFIIHNVFGDRSRMFIGDAGTMVMGLLMTWFTICLLRNDNLWSTGDFRFLKVLFFDDDDIINPVVFALAVLCVPVFDTLRVMVMRIARGRNPFLPDRTHLHHAFVIAGVGHDVTTFCEVIIQLVVVAIWLLSIKLGAGSDWQLYIVVIASMVLIWGTYALLTYHAAHHTDFLHKLTQANMHNRLSDGWRKRLTSFLDAPEDRMKAATVKMVVRGDHSDTKDNDRKKIFDFMRGKAEVMVYDIIINSGADGLRVYTILFEEGLKGNIRVIKTDYLGAPEIVALVNS